MKKFVLLWLTSLLVSCSFTSEIKQYEVEHKGYSNFTINHRELFPYEELFITVNDKYIYKYGLKKNNYWNIKYYKLPENVTKIEVKTIYKEKVILNKTFFDNAFKNKEVIITVPYPKKYKNKLFKMPPKYKKFSIEESERDINLKYY